MTTGNTGKTGSAGGTGSEGDPAANRASGEEIDAAAAALNRARQSSRGESAPIPHRGGQRNSSARAGRAGRSGSRDGGPIDASGPGPRDPLGLSNVLKRVIAERGWQSPVAVGSVLADWDSLVGPGIAAHCKPESFEGAVLQVRCDSTTWATQLRLLRPALLAKFAAELGDGVVSKINVLGPVTPNWQRGRRQVRGRGPRDTYG